MKTIAVAWFERPHMKKRWCRTASKTTIKYQDHVKTRCGYTITLPCGLSTDTTLIDCEECLAKERKR